MPPASEPDFCNEAYWNGLIKMGLSKAFVLAALADRPMHGYDIARHVETMTDGCCSPTAGALYPALAAFESGGYVTVESAFVGNRERKIYALTAKGRQALEVARGAWLSATQRLLDCPGCRALPEFVHADARMTKP